MTFRYLSSCVGFGGISGQFYEVEGLIRCYPDHAESAQRRVGVPGSIGHSSSCLAHTRSWSLKCINSGLRSLM